MLEVVPGVQDVSVDFSEKTATVTVAKGTPVATIAAGVSGRFSAKIKQ
jgi:hypothetical protein